MSKRRKIIIAASAALILALVIGALYLFVKVIPEKKEREELKRAAQEYYDNKLALYAEENEAYGDFEVDVAFIGDSLTDGYDVEKYYPEFKVENRGIGGETTHGLLARLDISVYQLKPKVIVMLIGANNFKTMFEDYEDLVIGIKENLPSTELVICSLTSMGGEHWGKNNQLAAFNNAKIKAYAEKHGCPYVDLFTPLLNVETGEIYEHYTTDGGHLTSKGYEVVTAQIKPVLEELLQKNNGAQN